MRKAVWRSAVAALALTLVAQVATAQGGRDTVVFNDGTAQWMQVNVTKETYKGIEVAGKGTKPPWVIAHIRHGDQPPSYVAATGALKRGDYERALGKFKEAMGTKTKARPWLKHYCAYYIALCEQKMADKPAALAKAIADYQKALKPSDGIKVPDAKFGIGECYYQMKDLPKAEAAFKEIASSDYGKFWQLKGKLMLGNILLDQGKGAEAAKVFDDVKKVARGKMAEIYYQAGLNEAAGLIQANASDTSKARELLTKIFDEAEEDAIKAAAHNGLGDAYRAEKRLKEARLEFLRVIVLYFDSPDEHARALFNVADCFEQLKEAPNARRFRNMLIQQHPDSVWRKRLGGK